jgi:hypothetical protein
LLIFSHQLLVSLSLHRDSIVEFSANVEGTSSKDVMDLLVLTQYFDTLQVRSCVEFKF